MHGTACSAHAMKPSQGGREETTVHLCRRHPFLHIQASQGSSYPWWVVAVAKRNLLLPECVGGWWQPFRDPIGAQTVVALCKVQVLAHKENPQRMLFTRDSRAVAMKVGICLGVCSNPPANLLYCERTRRPVIPHHHNPASTYNKERAAKLGENGLKWSKMGENGWQSKCATSSMHKKCKKALLWNNKLVKKGQN